MASIAGNILSITLRKNIEGITQRLGVITLKEHEAQDDEEEPPVQLFDWAGVAVATSAALETEVASLSANLHAQQERLTKLNGQLEDLIKAREEHENLLLEKFMELLNAKKLKIRDQQRLLAEAKIDPNKGIYFVASSSLNGPDRICSSVDQKC